MLVLVQACLYPVLAAATAGSAVDFPNFSKLLTFNVSYSFPHSREASHKCNILTEQNLCHH